MQLAYFRQHIAGRAEALMDLAAELLWVDQSAEAKALYDDCLQVSRKARALAYPPKEASSREAINAGLAQEIPAP